MRSTAIVTQAGQRWRVTVYWGWATTETIGPYRWKWVADLVAWFHDDCPSFGTRAR